LFNPPAAAQAFMSATGCASVLGPCGGMFPPYQERQLCEEFVNAGFEPPT
jgi:hypothetical protein